MPSVLLLPLPRFVAYDPGTGSPLAGGFVRTFVPGTTTPKQTYQDALGTIINPQPIVLDSAGSCLLYGTGSIQIATTDHLGNAVPAYSGIVDGTAPAVVPGFLFGFTLSNNVAPAITSLVISPGVAANSSGTSTITLSSAFTKNTLGAWVAGSGANGMGIGVTAAVDTWYHVFAVTVLGAADIYFDSSATAANAPVGTSSSRRIGSIRLGDGKEIVPFAQRGSRFLWLRPIAEYNAGPGITTGFFLSLAAVPPGVSTTALLTGQVLDTSIAGQILYLSSPSQDDLVPSAIQAITCRTPGVAGAASYAASIDTDTSQRIRGRVTAGTTTITVTTQGWIDMRGTN